MDEDFFRQPVFRLFFFKYSVLQNALYDVGVILYKGAILLGHTLYKKGGGTISLQEEVQ